MSLGLAYWILMLLWLILGLMWNWPGRPASPYWPAGNVVLLFVLFLLLGMHDFGAPIHG